MIMLVLPIVVDNNMSLKAVEPGAQTKRGEAIVLIAPFSLCKPRQFNY